MPENLAADVKRMEAITLKMRRTRLRDALEILEGARADVAAGWSHGAFTRDDNDQPTSIFAGLQPTELSFLDQLEEADR